MFFSSLNLSSSSLLCLFVCLLSFYYNQNGDNIKWNKKWKKRQKNKTEYYENSYKRDKENEERSKKGWMPKQNKKDNKQRKTIIKKIERKGV